MHGFHCREYTGYMALHIADTGPPGAAWAFTDEWRLQQVTPDMVRYLLTGCPKSQSSLCFCYFLGFWSKYRQTSDSHWKAHKIFISKLTLLSFLREKLTKLQHKM